ncbi:hypothetical protein [Neorhizobium sp. JUb45]|uniref:hypothetical protein n=1 Tax=Neorhizobium sp. JUb45 TaxID=2485113 RepID=UPI001050C52A|nr:hypothetical protein [Neorhizobium sp. JUb45]TCR07292.1 hypothetical protein EDF70_1011265 [Neorhizobium sp. JUb45]
MSDPIVVDIGAAMQMLEANPELARKMNELVLGPVIAEQLASREELINTLGEALTLSLDNMQAASDLFEDGHNGEAWEYVSSAQLATKKAVAEFREYAGQQEVA